MIKDSVHKICIAPMMQYTDMHDRYLLRLLSKKVFLYTEMIATGSLIYGKCFDQLEFNDEEHPVGVQLGGSDVNDLIECSKKCEQYGYDEINLNVGCPSDRVQKGKFGACLMLEPELVKDCLGNMRNAVQIPVSIKCRLGIDNNESYDFLYNFISIVKDSGIKINSLRVDGGACLNNYLMQFQSDLLGCDVVRPEIIESTAMGAGYLAGIHSNIWDTTKIKSNQDINSVFNSKIKNEKRTLLYEGWKDAVKRTLNWIKK